jgi:hypothetical protein
MMMTSITLITFYGLIQLDENFITQYVVCISYL